MLALTRRLRQLHPTVIVAAIGGCAVMGVLALVVTEAREPSWLVFILGIAVCLAAVLVTTRRRFGGLFWWHPAVIGAVFFALTYVARPLQLLLRTDHRTRFTSDQETIELGARALEVTFFFVLFATIAYIAVSRRAQLPAMTPTWSRLRLRKALLASSVVGCLGIGRVALASGGLSGILANSFGRRQTLEGQFYFTVLTYFLTGCLLFLVADIATRRTSFRSVLAPALLAAVLIVPLGGRSEFINVSISALAVWHVFGRRIPWLALPAAYLVLITFITIGLGLRLLTNPDRRLGEQALAEVSIDPRRAVPRLVDDGFTGFDRMATALPFIPDPIGFQTWTTYLRVLAAPVPRALWPGKPGLAEANVTREVFHTTTGGYPIGPAGEAWLQAGYAGLVVNGAIVGAVWAAVASLVIRSRHPENRIAAVIAAVTMFVGPSNLTLVQFGMRFIPIWLIGRYLASGPRGEDAGDDVGRPAPVVVGAVP